MDVVQKNTVISIPCQTFSQNRNIKDLMGGIEIEMLTNFSRKIRKDEATGKAQVIYKKTVMKKKTTEMECDILHWIFVPKNRAVWHNPLHGVTKFRFPCKVE